MPMNRKRSSCCQLWQNLVFAGGNGPNPFLTLFN